MLCFHIEIRSRNALIRLRQAGLGALFFSLVPVATYAQSGSPFDTGFTNLQTLFTGTIAKVASLIAIVIGGYGFAHGEPGAFCPDSRNNRNVTPDLSAIARLFILVI